MKLIPSKPTLTNMTSLSSLRSELTALCQRFEDDPSIVVAKKALAQARANLRKEIQPEIARVEREIKQAKEAKAKALVPLDAKATDFLRRVQMGVSFSSPTLEHLVGPFYILHLKGGTYTSGMDRLYGCATHELLDLSRDDKGFGYQTYCKCRVRGYEKEGRFTKADRAKWLTDATAMKVS